MFAALSACVQLDVRDQTPLLLSSRDEEMLLVASFSEVSAYLDKVPLP